MDPYALFDVPEKTQRAEQLRELFARLLKDADLPSGTRETSLAITKLQEAHAWALKSLTAEARKEC